MDADLIASFGLLATLIAKHKRLKKELEQAKQFRWHYVQVEKQLFSNRMAIHYAFAIPTEY